MIQETLHYDPVSDRLTPLRSKEEAHDYRYFPEPDLVPLLATEEMLDAARAALPAELPAERAARFERELGLNPGRAQELAFRAELGDYFERALAADGGCRRPGGALQLDPAAGRADRAARRPGREQGRAREPRRPWPRWSRPRR